MKVVFQNKGEIDPRAFSSFGINVKESDSPIGFFGTGLKYALAVLLREGCQIEAFSGTRHLKFSLVPGDFRGKVFDFIHMEVDSAPSVELGFTTELGKNWELWSAYREVACNCLDEGGTAMAQAEAPKAVAGQTSVIVTGPAFLDEHVNRHKTLLESAPLFSTAGVAVHAGGGHTGYYRGVRVITFQEHSLMTYNLLSSQALTEDRTLKDTGALHRRVALMYLAEVEDRGLLRMVLLAKDGTLEHTLDFHGWASSPSPAFLATVGELLNLNAASVNVTAVRVWKDATKQRILPTEFSPTSVQQAALEKAISFCGSLGYNVRLYEVKLVDSLGEGCLALAKDNCIYLTQRVFQQGVKALTSTLIEEYLHLHYKYEDCSRELQTYLFDALVSLGEECQGAPL